MISIETKDHIKKLASDYKCWSATITYHEALELCEMIEDIEALNAINLDLADENEDLVERIGKLIGYIDFLRNVGTGKKKSLDYLEKVVKGQIKEIRAEGENFVKPKTGEWIPVTERLPEDKQRVIVTRKSGTIGYITWNTWWHEQRDYPTDKVIAWMHLPQPYKAESEEEDGNDI